MTTLEACLLSVLFLPTALLYLRRLTLLQYDVSVKLLAALLLRRLARVTGRRHQAHIDCGPQLLVLFLGLPRHRPG